MGKNVRQPMNLRRKLRIVTVPTLVLCLPVAINPLFPYILYPLLIIIFISVPLLCSSVFVFICHVMKLDSQPTIIFGFGIQLLAFMLWAEPTGTLYEHLIGPLPYFVSK